MNVMSCAAMDRHFAGENVQYAVHEFYRTAKWLMTTDDVDEMPHMINWVEAAEKRMGNMCRPADVVLSATKRLQLMKALGMESKLSNVDLSAMLLAEFNGECNLNRIAEISMELFGRKDVIEEISARSPSVYEPWPGP